MVRIQQVGWDGLVDFAFQHVLLATVHLGF